MGFFSSKIRKSTILNFVKHKTFYINRKEEFHIYHFMVDQTII